MPRFGRILGRSGRALGGAVGGAAAGAGGVLDIISGVVSQLQQFVQALSPSTVALFSQALKDLNATIGQAFQPAFIVLADVVRGIADQISPAMQQLAPILAQLVEVFGSSLIRAVNSFVIAFQAIMPVIEIFLDVIEKLAPAFQAIHLVAIALQVAFVTPLVALFKLLRPVIEYVVNALREFAKNMILATIYLLKFLDMTGAIRKIIEALEVKEGGRVTAQGPTSIKDLQGVVKDLALASAQAQGHIEGPKEDPYMKELIAAAKDAAANGTTLMQFLEEKWKEFLKEWDKLIKAFIEWADRQVPGGGNAAAAAVGGVNGPGVAFAGGAGGLFPIPNPFTRR